MKAIATLCGVTTPGGQNKIISLDPSGELFFVNREDLQGAYKDLLDQTEKSGKVTVLGMLFAPGVEE